jgi:hypothetical protein
MASFLWRVSKFFGIPFAWLIKLPGLAGDVITAALLYFIWRRSHGRLYGSVAVAGFSWSLCSIAMTGYHGNTDGLYAGLSLFSAFAFQEWKRPLVAGLGLAAAINVKLIPVLLLPPLAFLCRSWRELGRLALGVGVGILPFAVLLGTAGDEALSRIVSYSAVPDLWGIPALLIRDPGNLWQRLHEEEALIAYRNVAKYLIVLAVLMASVLGRIERRWTAYEVGAVALALFLILAPGFGIQYLAALVPLMFAVSLGSAAIYSSLAGIFMAVTYRLYLRPGEGPWSSHFAGPFPMPAPLFGMLVWAFLIGYVVQRVRRKEVLAFGQRSARE